MPVGPLPYCEIRRRLEAAGFVEISQKGGHVKFVRNAEGTVRVAIVPNHREIPVGTLRSILHQADLTADEFDEL